MLHSFRPFLALLLLPAVMHLSGLQAYACGGFFCDNFPMNQVAENILFIQGEGTVTTHVQLQYSGEASDFAWILPMPSVPELAVSHNQIFNQLQFATQPGFQLNFQEEAGCGFPPIFRTLEDDGSVVAAESAAVEVVSQEQVGPYDTAVITSDDSQAIVNWLVDNDYQLDDLGINLLHPYVEEGAFFLALKLVTDRDVGDLQPIALTYAAEEPGIPIRLTAVATAPELSVIAWVLAEHRAIPKNYLHVRINEAAIDWFNGGFNYPEVVTLATNEAEGQAFVTDFAGPSKIVNDLFFGEFDLKKLRLQEHPADFLDAALSQGFPRDAQMQALIRRHIPMPSAVLAEGVLEVIFGGDREAYDRIREEGQLQSLADRSFYNNIRAYDRYITDLEFNAVAFADDLERIVVEPLQNVRRLFAEKPYLTRLYTTLSADEMTLDPMFSYNPDLPEVDNIRFAEARWDCADPDNTPIEKWELIITLADGREIRTLPFGDGGGPRPLPIGEPAAAIIERLGTSGPPETIRRLTAVAETGNGSVPSDWFLRQNYPNPFNSSTVLPFQAPASTADVALHIYNLQGQKVRTLAEGPVIAGYREITWDGRDQNGRIVASGVYLYRLKIGSIDLTRKLLFLR
ncbi:MAG TPA: DUF2330 domain-containing protein [Candidatus Handelsmanbacteria bacterium]|nr:DUF2330 domain-containing protein [Candidatus Handelsmanbacteria bacterium]